MTTQHSAITDPNIHEPKGVSTATSGQLYVANGAGSGTWKQADSTMLKSLSGDGGVANLRMLSDGNNGFKLKTDSAFGTMGWSANGNAITIAAASAVDLSTNYQKVTGVGAPWASEQLNGVTVSMDTLTIPTAGTYRISLVAAINGFPAASSKVGFKFMVNSTLQSRKAVESGGTTDAHSAVLDFMYAFSANDTLTLYVASTTTGNLLISDLALVVSMIKAT